MMASLYQRLAAWGFNQKERIKGSSRLVAVRLSPNLSEDLTAYSVSGFQIRIYCKLEHNRREYDRWFIPSEDLISYRVYGVASSDAPQALREVCDYDVVVPYTKRWIFSTSRSSAIKVYLNVLIKRLELLSKDSQSLRN